MDKFDPLFPVLCGVGFFFIISIWDLWVQLTQCCQCRRSLNKVCSCYFSDWLQPGLRQLGSWVCRQQPPEGQVWDSGTVQQDSSDDWLVKTWGSDCVAHTSLLQFQQAQQVDHASLIWVIGMVNTAMAVVVVIAMTATRMSTGNPMQLKSALQCAAF